MHSSRTHLARRRPLAAGPSQSAALRLAFTLLELLISISIIAILAGLILTVASSAMIRAHNAQVSADIQSLAAGIAGFKQRFGVEPPSSITLYEKAAGWTNDPRSMGLIRQIWPQFDFTYAAEGGTIDINGDGLFTGDGASGDTATGAIPLSGVECLVFFLGGVPGSLNPLAFGGPPAGFSQSPADPFSVTVSGTTRTVTGSSRLSFTEFDKSRLVLYTPAGGSQHTMNAYIDTLSAQTQPYLYLSSYGGQGYNINELVGASPSAGNAPGAPSPDPNGIGFIDVYRQGSQGYWAATSSTQPESGQNLTQNTGSVSPPWNANSYQIISPGGDHLYGVGGEYETATANTLLTIYPGTTAVDRTGERDNITNFSSGTLAP